MVHEISDNLRRSIRRLGREGYGVSTIAQLCGVSRPTVRKYLVIDPDEERVQEAQSEKASTPPPPVGYFGMTDDSAQGDRDHASDRTGSNERSPIA